MRDIKCVYAGPEYFERKAKEKVEKEPEPDDTPIECVYAGPEYFNPGILEEEIKVEPVPEEAEKPQEPEPEKEEKKKPKKPDRNDLSQYAGVYAGPAQMGGDRRDMSQFMMAYAGPSNSGQIGMFVNSNGPIGFPMTGMPVPEQTKKCPACGREGKISDKFCAGCGARFPEAKFCPGCGAKYTEGMKFCTECGTVLKND
ncbi:MAG: zinc ribbon domain-containing protein [Clostridia bacterium]|nr:zinc ribbon domain-containing protein [Clostridia bacterium]